MRCRPRCPPAAGSAAHSTNHGLRLQCDVAAVAHALEGDALDVGIGARAGGVERVAAADHGEDAAAGGDVAAVVATLGTGVEAEHVGVERIEAGDDPAGAGGARTTARRGPDSAAGAGVPGGAPRL